MSLTKLPVEERPRERLLLNGSEALSLAELLAIIIGKGTRGRTAIDLAHELLSDFGGLRQLMKATITELSHIRGIGQAKAIQIKALFEIIKRASRETQVYPIPVRSMDEIATLLRRFILCASQELLFVVCLNTKGMITHIEEIGRGTLATVLIHPREVFSVAVAHKAAQAVLAHNHPSGDTTPSKKDLEATAALIQAGQLMHIPLMEHIILSETEYTFLINKKERMSYQNL